MSGFKVLIGRVSHETNTFSNVKTNLNDFDQCYGDEIFSVYENTKTELGGFISVLKNNDVTIIPTVAASATPSGIVDNDAFVIMKDRILEGLHNNGRIDGVLFSFHGSMVAENEMDPEGSILQSISKLTLKTAPVMCTFDLHAMISDLIINNIDGVFGFDTNPHIDMYERGVEAATVMMSTLKREIHPVVAFKKLRMIPPSINMRTTEGPMVKLFNIAREMEAQEKVINVSIFGGYGRADVHRIGSSVVVMTDNDYMLAENLSLKLGHTFWSIREDFLKKLTPLEIAVERAIKAKSGPIILADVADNPGGGAPGDSTFILKELIKRDAKNVGIVIKDPEAVEKAIKIGVKRSIKIQIGGKTDHIHGKPVEVNGKIKTITDGEFIHKAMRVGLKADVGRTVVIDNQGIEIILTEKSHAPNDPEIFRRNGIEPNDKKILVLKSRGHFRAAYEPFSKEIIEVDAPGLTTQNMKWYNYQMIPRPIWPIDDV